MAHGVVAHPTDCLNRFIFVCGGANFTICEHPKCRATIFGDVDSKCNEQPM